MSNFAPAPVVPTELPSIAGTASREALQKFAENERNRFSKGRQKAVVNQSRAMSCYIYSVGPFPFARSCASKGTKYFPALLKEKVLLPNDFSVAFCFANEGMPAEVYPDLVRNKWIEHAPQEEIGSEVNGGILMFADNPGYDEALRFIGAHPQSNKQDDLRDRGIFVSLIPEQAKPEGPEYPGDSASPKLLVAYERDKAHFDELWKMYEEWIGNVTQARADLRKWIVNKLEDAREKYNRGQFIEVREDLLYDLGKLVKQSGIDIDCPWLKDTSEASGTIPCQFCGSSIPLKARKCKVCLEWQEGMEPKGRGKGAKQVTAEQ